MHYLKNGDLVGPGFDSIWGDFSATAHEYGWVDVGGTSTRCLTAGEDGSPPLLFLHGTGGHIEAFSRNIGPQSAGHRTYAIDMIGHGWSDLADRPLEIADYVEHVIDFLDGAGIEKIAISGVSLGGWVAARLAIDHPERVSALVLNTPGGSRADSKVMSKIRSSTSLAVEEVSPESVRSRLEFLVADPERITDELVACRLAVYSRPGMSENMKFVLALQDPEVRERNLLGPEDFGRIKAPTLIVWTTQDPTGPPAEGERIAAMIPGARYVLLEDCGHWPQFEKPELFNRLQLEFLENGQVDAAAVALGSAR